MKKIILLLTIFCLSANAVEDEGILLAFNDTDFGKLIAKAEPAKKAGKKYFQAENPLAKAKELALAKQYAEASSLLFRASRSPQFRGEERAKVKYLLGLMLEKMDLNQVASFVYFDVINEEARTDEQSKYLKQSIAKLSVLSNKLDSDVLLKFAISKIKVKDFPKVQKDLFYYRLGELHMKEEKYAQAADSFSKVESESSVFPKALYKLGLSNAELKKNKSALDAFSQLEDISQNRGITDVNRNDAILGKARIYYQAKKWEAAINEYRQIPRDTPQWHESLFETSWAMMMSGRYFRSALSNFQTLHSSYYEDDFAPESLILRAIVYLFICKYDEMEKVIKLFNRIYKPVRSNISRFLEGSASEDKYWREIQNVDKYLREVQAGKDVDQPKGRLPFMVSKWITKQSNVRKNLNYLNVIGDEKAVFDKQPSGWKDSAVGRYAQRVLDRRVKSTQELVAKQSRANLVKLKSDLRDYFEQVDLLELEQTRGQKEAVGKKIKGKVAREQITADESRDFFISNGYDYWPFQGEYWLDELGNYHYVGVQACE